MKRWKLWQKILLFACLCSLTFFGARRFLRLRKQAAIQRRAVSRKAAATAKAPVAAVAKNPDDRVVLREEHPVSLQDEKNLKGRTLWVSDGGQMTFYPYTGKGVDFSHPLGVLLGAERIEIRDAIEQAGPKGPTSEFPDADAQVLLIFTRPDDARNPSREYGVAVGDREGHDFNLITDQLFFYDDPHKLYAFWGPKVWQSIDAHTATVGMTERQLQMALGQVSTPRGDMMGDRSVEFDDQGKPKLVTFAENGKAIEIRDETQ